MSDSSDTGGRGQPVQFELVPTEVDFQASVRTVPYLPDDTPVVFADGIVIARGPGVWNFAFTQAQIPLETDPARIPKEIPTKCVVRVVVSTERLPDFLKVIRDSALSAGLPPILPSPEKEDAGGD